MERRGAGCGRDSHALRAADSGDAGGFGFAEVSAKGQSGFGTWGHGFAYPEENDGELHGRLGGYGELNSAGLTVHYGLVLAQLCGIDTDNAVTGERLERTLEAGRGFAARDAGRSFYDQRSAEQLLEDLASWSPTVRRWAIRALTQKADDQVIAQLLAMLDPANDPYTRYGACEALAALGRDTADAVPALTAMLEEDDLWLKAQAARALAGIGPPARSALPAILRAAAEVDENDPRRMLQRYLSFALFNRRGGMLANGLGQVDREALLRTVAAVLTNPAGRARGAASSVYRHLDYQQLQPILPTILDSIENLAPSGIMFADGIRLAGLDLLTQNHIQEAMPLCIDIIKPDRWGVRRPLQSQHELPRTLRGVGQAADPRPPAVAKGADRQPPQPRRGRAPPRVDEVIEHIESAERSPELRFLRADLEPRVDPQRTEFFENLMREYGLTPNADQ